MKTIVIKRVLAPFSFGLVCALGTGCDSGNSTATAGARPYPLEVCPVSGEKLGGMGEPVVFVHQDQEIKLCCKNCRKDFDAEPAKYLAKLTVPAK